MHRTLHCALLILALGSSALYAASPATVNNDDSCDVIVTPAATLLLPYFDVNLQNTQEGNTIFSVTNVTQLPRIARVTIWTDWAFPVFSYNVFLPGYDVQSIDVSLILLSGLVSGLDGTSSDDYPGNRALENDQNPLLDISECNTLVRQLPPAVRQQLVRVLTTGRGSGPCPDHRVGGEHAHAVGYITIDVVESCNAMLPTDPGYFTSEILYDNVLTGDYRQVNRGMNTAQGGPLVHIRAIPEGGGPGAHPTNFTATFYSNYQNGGTADRRQPLPATFAARWISGADGALKTNFKIWREGITRAHSGCAVASNDSLTIADIVRFDEDENPVAFSDCETCGAPLWSRLPASSRSSSDDDVFPPRPDGATAGWMYMNLNNQGVFPFRPFRVASQNWVIVSMEAEDAFDYYDSGASRYTADFDAASLGNGCTPSISPTGSASESGDETAIAPAANTIIPRRAGGSPATIGNDDSCDIKVAPAATLLLPYFEVDLQNRSNQTTLFTITNVTPLPQIARATIWTDYAFPVLTFNLFLTGYDVQAINLFDVLEHGRIGAEGGTSSDSDTGRRSAGNDANERLDTSACGQLPGRISPQSLADLRSALTLGRTTACGTARVGAVHGSAIGSVTIDVVRNCSSTMPVEAGYFSNEILYDNVLIGDYQQVHPAGNSAQSNTMVHIRAIPEGGLSGSATSSFRRTFYSRLQNGGTSDRRQPLPSTFAARWIEGGVGELNTSFKVWREGVTGAGAGCAVSANAAIPYPDIVRFNDWGRGEALRFCEIIITVPPDCGRYRSPALARFDNRDTNYLPRTNSDVAGWMYFNFDDSWSSPDDLAAQSWVVVSMEAEGRFAVDLDATALGNGCSPPALETNDRGGEPAIGPAPNVNPRATPNP
jgi:hypothetical protein